MFEFLRRIIGKRYIEGVVRAILAALAGWLIKQGADGETVAQLMGQAAETITGIIMILLTIFWSWKDKAKTVEK